MSHPEKCSCTGCRHLFSLEVESWRLKSQRDRAEKNGDHSKMNEIDKRLSEIISESEKIFSSLQ